MLGIMAGANERYGTNVSYLSENDRKKWMFLKGAFIIQP